MSFCFVNLNATHNRAGEITYVQLSDLTYEITITTFTYTLSFADRPTLDVEWGDNTTSTARGISMLTLPNYYRRNIYKINHTYPGPGSLQNCCSGSKQKCRCKKYSKFSECCFFDVNNSDCQSVNGS